MLDEEKAIQKIIELIDDPDGFTVILHVQRFFDEEKYEKIKTAINEYKTMIEEKELISRKMVGRLFFLEQVIENATALYSESERHLEQAKKIVNAHAEIWDLVDSIFSWPDED